MSEHQITLTDDECNVLRAILYGGVGGPASGRLGRPRRIVESIAAKVPWPNPGAYTAGIKSVNRFGGQAVVVTAAETGGEA